MVHFFFIFQSIIFLIVFFIKGNNFKLSVYECFLLSSALSSKDSFTASLMIDHHMLGDLHSIVFGEGLVNDSTALTLFSAL